jgi:hypothetical protein
MSTSRAAISSRRDFHEALRGAFEEAAQRGYRELWLSDPDFSDWPLGERSVVESLQAWVGSRRRLVLAATNFDALVRQHARWLAWRQPWSHVVQCCTNSELEAGDMPTLLLAPEMLCVQLVDRVHHRGAISREPPDLVRCQQLFDAVLQRSEPAFPVTTAGL